jgi:hypothetical protein
VPLPILTARTPRARCSQIAERLTTPLQPAELQAQKLLALSNKFYNTIPHKFARQDTPPIIDSVDALRVKSDMVESLLSISQVLHRPPPPPALSPPHPS